MCLWPEKYHTWMEIFWFSNIFQCFDDGESGWIYTPCASGQKNTVFFPVLLYSPHFCTQNYTHTINWAIPTASKRGRKNNKNSPLAKAEATRPSKIGGVTFPHPRHRSVAGKIIFPQPTWRAWMRRGGVTFPRPHQRAILTWNALSHVSGNFLIFQYSPLFWWWGIR